VKQIERRSCVFARVDSNTFHRCVVKYMAQVITNGQHCLQLLQVHSAFTNKTRDTDICLSEMWQPNLSQGSSSSDEGGFLESFDKSCECSNDGLSSPASNSRNAISKEPSSSLDDGNHVGEFASNSRARAAITLHTMNLLDVVAIDLTNSEVVNCDILECGGKIELMNATVTFRNLKRKKMNLTILLNS
jgi:hypothetical protein